MIFPELGPQYYEERHRGILARIESFYAEGITVNQSFWGEADADTRFYVGDQSAWNDMYGNLPANRRRNYSFNRIMRNVNLVDGYQRRNRKSTIVMPVENSDEITADQFTKVLMWCNNQESILDTISEAFHGALVTGMNLLQVWMDYRSDPVSGNIRVDNCSYNSFMIDPFFRKADLSDCNAIYKRTFLTKEECISLMPNHADTIVGLWGTDSGTGRDGKFQFLPESYGYAYKNLLTYDEFYYRDYRTQKMIVDTRSGETMEWKSDDKDSLDRFLSEFPELMVINNEIPTVRLAIVIQGRVFYDGPQPMGIDEYPFIPVFAYYNPQMPYWPYRMQGMVRQLRDIQYLYNRRKAIELDILESQINSGWIYKENALVNPADIYNLSGQGKGLALKEEAQMTDVQQIIAPQIPPSMIELSNILSKEIQEISGVNEELLGMASDSDVGITTMLRQGAGLTTLQILFDQLDRSQKMLGNIMIKLIQANFTPGKIKRILGEDPADAFYNKNFGRYDAVVEEGINSATQKQMQLAQLLQLREMGLPIPDDVIIDACTIQNKKKLIDRMKQDQQQNQQGQQQAQELSLKEIEAKINLANARAVADRGLGLERESRVDENEALAIERKAQAKRDEEAALLDMVRALKEIEDIDVGQLHKLVTLHKMLEAEQNIVNGTDTEPLIKTPKSE
jgi:hypothetical protein